MRWLLDEMLPRAAAEYLNRHGHDAVSVYDLNLAGADDADVFSRAIAEDRVLVTENFADYSCSCATGSAPRSRACPSCSSTSPPSRQAGPSPSTWPIT